MQFHTNSYQNNELEFNSNIYGYAKNKEGNLVAQNFQDAQSAISSGTIPRQHNQKIFQPQKTEIYNHKKQIPSLTGKYVESTDFTHNNMMPFFGAKQTQNVGPNSSRSTLSSHNGTEYFTNKKEDPPLFQLRTNQNTNPVNQNDYIQSRTLESRYRRSELPFQQVKVGKGLGGGYNSKPTGGFHPDYRQNIMPKNVDQLRAANNPKISYKARNVKGKFYTGKRGVQGKMEKNRPDGFYLQTPDQYLKTNGAVLKAKRRPGIYLKETNRKTSVHYIPPAATENKAQMGRSLFKKSTKRIFETSGPRNIAQNEGSGDIDFGDYGKQSIPNAPNERTCTGEKTRLGSLSSIIKALTAPILDTLRTTKKENMVGSIRPTGNINSRAKLGNVAYDKDTMKFRTTIKETTENNCRHGNLKGPIKLTTYDPNDISRTTIKETNIHDVRTGNVGGLENGDGYMTNEMEARNTNRQFTSDNSYEGIVNSEGTGLGYITNEKNAPNTNRQFTSDIEYTGAAGSFYKRMVSREKDYNARVNTTKEGTLIGRSPTKESVKLAVGKDRINMTINKLDTDRIVKRRPQVQKVYLDSHNSISEVTKRKQTYRDAEVLKDKLQPELLNAFKSNPFTHSLSSY